MSNAAVSSSGRLASVDALRGLTVAAMLLVNDPGDWGHVYWPLEHAEWNGCTPTDLIFPFFLFIVGVSIALALGPRLERGDARAPLLRAAMGRALRILLLGVAINLLAAWLLPGRDMRWPGVLQRIGVCFAVTAALAIHTPRRAWWISLGSLLAGYAVLLHFGGTARWDNPVDRVDGMVFGHYVWDHNTVTGQVHDPEGLLSTLPAIASTLLGLCAGTWLRAGARRALLIAGVMAVVVGWLAATVQPFNKNLWTPSFVLWTAGWAMLSAADLPRADRPARLARAGASLRRQCDRRLRRLRADADPAAGQRSAAGALPAWLRRLDHAAGRPPGGLARLGDRFRGAVVGDRVGDGSARDIPQAVGSRRPAIRR